MQVAIVLAAYNCAAYLAEAIESVLAQTYRDFYLYLINDGSTDDTLSIMQAYARQDERVRVISHENWGMHRSINAVLPMIQTESEIEWALRMDGDDVMTPERLERQVAFIRENPRVRVFSCQGRAMNVQGQLFGQLPLTDITTETRFRQWLDGGEPIVLLHPGVAMHLPTVLSVGGYREMWPCEDVDLWMRIAAEGHLILLQDEVLMHYRIHPNAATMSRWHDMALNLDWIRAGIRARREGQPAPTREEFLRQRNAIPLLQKLMRERRTLAQYLDRMAAFQRLQNRPMAAAWRYLLVGALQPGFTLRRLRAMMATVPHIRWSGFFGFGKVRAAFRPTVQQA